MKRKVFSIGIILLLACGGKLISQENNTKKAFKDILFDTSRTAILNTREAINFGFNNSYSSTKLNETEYFEAQNLIIQAILKYNSGFKDSNRIKRFGIDTNRYEYKIQVVPALNRKGEKEIWINAFCSTYGQTNWRKQIVFVEDGGNCFFNLKINLTEHKVYQVLVNGYA